MYRITVHTYRIVVNVCWRTSSFTLGSKGKDVRFTWAPPQVGHRMTQCHVVRWPHNIQTCRRSDEPIYDFRLLHKGTL